MLWLQTGGSRFSGPDRPHLQVPRVPGIGWSEAVTAIPETTRDIRYDHKAHQLSIGTGIVDGVRPEVWDFEVSGMNVIDRWLGARTRKGTGRAAGKSAAPLDRIRPTEWEDEWNDELLDLIRVLTVTTELAPKQKDLLERITTGSLIKNSELPAPRTSERNVPRTIQRGFVQETLLCVGCATSSRSHSG
ncbi:hypothetical protein GS907_26075 [Rhodococcus hoagii]|nr:hypothetical protein [Prescottella equi]